ncbi:MAG: maleylacetate reductase [Pseudomonadota bacterium]
MQPFVYNALPSRVIFGSGTIARLKSEIERAGCRRALLLSTPEQADVLGEIAASLGSLAAGTFTQAAMHTPTDVTERALSKVQECKADCTVSFGGGSSTGLGKAIALRTDLTQIAVPTTYAGSEVTPIIGETKDGVKVTQRTLKVLPEIVIYDVDFTLSLPQRLTVTSGTNAIAHAVEALYAEDRNPVISMMAEQAISAMGRALPAIVEDPNAREARAEALYGAWLCGVCLGSVGMALHHKLCHVIGGAFDLPHADTHTVILPYAMAYNAKAAPEADRTVARALGNADGTSALVALSKKLGSPQSLKSLGMPESGIDRAADLAVQNPYWNPRPIERDAIRRLIAAAWAGDPPAALNEKYGT